LVPLQVAWEVQPVELLEGRQRPQRVRFLVPQLLLVPPQRVRFQPLYQQFQMLSKLRWDKPLHREQLHQ